MERNDLFGHGARKKEGEEIDFEFFVFCPASRDFSSLRGGPPRIHWDSSPNKLYFLQEYLYAIGVEPQARVDSSSIYLGIGCI